MKRTISPFRVSLWAQGGVYRIHAARGAARGERLPGRQSDLCVRQLRATIHDVAIAGVAEHPVALPGGQFLDDTELLQVAKRLVDRRRGEAELPDQRARGGEGVRQQRLVDQESGGRRPDPGE